MNIITNSLVSKISNLLKKEFIRFAIVGVLATAIQYGVYLLFLRIVPESNYQVNIALSIGYGVSFVCNFILTSVFTFRSKANAKKTIGFIMSHAINFGLQNGLIRFFMWLSLPSIAVHVASYEWLVKPEEYALIFVLIIAVPVNFLLVRFAFKSKWTQ